MSVACVVSLFAHSVTNQFGVEYMPSESFHFLKGFSPALLILILIFIFQPTHSAPPYDGTIFLDPDIIIDSDPTAYESMVYVKRETRQTFDRRVNSWVNTDCFVFKASFSDGTTAEYEVNAEFGSIENAQKEAEFYGPPIGQMPKVVRTRMKKVTIHAGDELYGGGGEGVLIHTGQTAQYLDLGILPETLLHEASHTSLDPVHAAAAGWISAQQKDVEFISTYARDNPTREDVAESFLPIMAALYKQDRISTTMRQTVERTVPNRIEYFKAQNFDYSPVTTTTPIFSQRKGNLKLHASDSRGVELQGLLSKGDFASLIGIRPRQEDVNVSQSYRTILILR
jgi:hypothetical protein